MYALSDSGSEGDSQELVITVTETQLTWTTHNGKIDIVQTLKTMHL